MVFDVRNSSRWSLYVCRTLGVRSMCKAELVQNGMCGKSYNVSRAFITAEEAVIGISTGSLNYVKRQGKRCIYPNVPWPILASFSNLVAASQNGKLCSSRYFSRSRPMFICGLGDGVDGGVNTPFRFVMAAVLKAVGETVSVAKKQLRNNWDENKIKLTKRRTTPHREREHKRISALIETGKKKKKNRSSIERNVRCRLGTPWSRVAHAEFGHFAHIAPTRHDGYLGDGAYCLRRSPCYANALISAAGPATDSGPRAQCRQPNAKREKRPFRITRPDDATFFLFRSSDKNCVRFYDTRYFRYCFSWTIAMPLELVIIL